MGCSIASEHSAALGDGESQAWCAHCQPDLVAGAGLCKTRGTNNHREQAQDGRKMCIAVRAPSSDWCGNKSSDERDLNVVTGGLAAAMSGCVANSGLMKMRLHVTTCL